MLVIVTNAWFRSLNSNYFLYFLNKKLNNKIPNNNRMIGLLEL